MTTQNKCNVFFILDPQNPVIALIEQVDDHVLLKSTDNGLPPLRLKSQAEVINSIHVLKSQGFTPVFNDGKPEVLNVFYA